jgi:Ca2+-binding RTX toxin-like protein
MAEPNDSFSQATFDSNNIYLEQNFYTSDSVSPGDLNDYYGFYTLYGPSTLYASLLGLSADADLYIYDQNYNYVTSSTAGGNTSETINVSLQGNQYYYVRVLNYNSANTTNYGLYLYNDYSGPTLATARDIGTSWGQGSSRYWSYDKIAGFWQDYLDYRDNVDVVKFTMEAPGTISLRMKDFTYTGALQATMQLLDSGGSILQTVAGDVGAGLNVDRYSVPAGTYYVRFTQNSGSDPYTFRIVTDYAGDSTFTARDLGNLSGTSRQLYDMVSAFGGPTYDDANDLYKFTLDRTSPVDLRLTVNSYYFPSPTFDANLRLARDTDGNGFISPGEVILSSSNPGSDQLSTTLGAGTYYVQVVQNGAYTSYQIDLDSDFDAVPGDPQAYNNMSQARSFGTLIGETPFNYADGFGISAGDFSDYFKFTMSAAGKLSASAFVNSYYSRTTENPSLSIVRDTNGNNRLDAGETITPFSVGSLSTTLAAGTYFLHTSGNGQQAAYTVRLVPDYAGNTLSTARPFAAISGATPPTQTFRDYIEQSFDASSDVNDFYRFDLPSSYQVTLNTTGVSGEDLSLSLIKDANSNNVIDAGDVLVTSNALNSPSETISRALTPGRYFARVQGINGSTNYTLTASFGPGRVATGTAGNNSISGDFLNDTLNGLDGNDTLNGLAGNDSLIGGAGNDSLAGGSGIDTMVGGSGNDLYGVDSAGDRVIESAGGGTDTINTSISLTLPAEVEILQLLGSTNLNGTGNSLNNRILGNSGANTLSGLAGNDTLIGGLGNDLLIGGTGNDVLTSSSTSDIDIFRFASISERQDSITDFDRTDSAAVVGSDRDIIQVSNAGFNPTGGASDLVNGILPTNRLVNGTASLGALAGFRYFESTGQLFFDSNGGSHDPGAGSLLLLTLTNPPATRPTFAAMSGSIVVI